MEQTKKNKLIQIIYKMTSSLTALCAALLLLAFFTAFDADKGYFEPNAPLPTVFQACFIVTVASSLAPVLLLGKNTVVLSTDKVASNAKRAHSLIGIALVLLGMFSFYLDMDAAYSGIPTAMCGVGCSALGVYYLLIALKESYKRMARLKLVCLFVSMALPMGIIMQNNSNFHRSINSVENTLCAVFAVAFLLYILYEGKRLVSGEENGWRAASLFLMQTAAMVYSPAYLLAYVLGAVNEGGRFYMTLYLLLIGLMSRVTLRTLVRNVTREHPEPASTLDNNADLLESESGTDDLCESEAPIEGPNATEADGAPSDNTDDINKSEAGPQTDTNTEG